MSTPTPRKLIAGREVVSKPGAAIKVTRLILTPEGKAALQAKSPEQAEQHDEINGRPAPDAALKEPS